jgi:hypothetical protein
MVKDPRKRKSTLSQRKKQVKQSATKKQKRGLKYRNADLRVSLDSQAQEIFAVRIPQLCVHIVNSSWRRHTDGGKSERTTASRVIRGSRAYTRTNHAGPMALDFVLRSEKRHGVGVCRLLVLRLKIEINVRVKPARC